MRQLGLDIVEAAYKRENDISEILTLLEKFNALGNRVDGCMARLIELYLAREKTNVAAAEVVA